MIPKIIHYCWFGKNTKGYMARRCISSFNNYVLELRLSNGMKPIVISMKPHM